MNLLFKFFPQLEAYRIVIEIALIAISCASLIGGWTYLVHKHDEKVKAAAIAPYAEAIEKQKQLAAKELANETAKTKAAEAKLIAQTEAQNDKDKEHEATVADLSRQLASRKLRDPYAGRGSSRGSAQGATATASQVGTGNGAQGTGVFSEEASGVLRELMLDADRINNAYAACRADAMNIRRAAQ